MDEIDRRRVAVFRTAGMLGMLDEMPNGWKRLALGLLEAEAFRRELRNCLPQESVAVTIPPQPAKRVIPRRMQVGLTCAVGLICLGLGIAIEHHRQPVATFVDRPIPVATPTATDEMQTHQTLKLVFADGPSGAQSVEVPVIDAEAAKAAEMLQQSAVSDELRQKLEAQGYVIHEERTYVPVSLANGRQGIAPISDVVVEYQPVAFQ